MVRRQGEDCFDVEHELCMCPAVLVAHIISAPSSDAPEPPEPKGLFSSRNVHLGAFQVWLYSGQAMHGYLTRRWQGSVYLVLAEAVCPNFVSRSNRLPDQQSTSAIGCALTLTAVHLFEQTVL